MFHHRLATTHCLLDEVFSSWKQRRLRVSECSAHIEKVLDSATAHNSHIDMIGAYVFGIVWNAMNSECGVAGTGKSDANAINSF